MNENGSSNSPNYRQYQNQFFMAAKYGGFEADPANVGANPYNTYGNPFQQQNGTNNNNVWQDPNNPGDANAYYLSSNARAELSAFDSIFNRASSAARSIAGAAVQSKNLTTAGSAIYQASFDTSDWSGDVVSTPVTVTTSGTVTLSSSNNWSASTQLDAMTAPATNRNIVVGKAGATSNPTATAFTWAAIETGLQTNLAKLTPTTPADAKAQDRLNYLRGDHSNEGTGKPFRTRSKLMGDVINSGVVYSGTPTTSIGYSSSYASFYTANASRGGTVFVGANDGMLHAFNASTGNETFAYIPSWMGPKLAALTATTYPNNHQSYVDTTPVVAEAQTGTTGAATDWKTVLVSGTGNGGSGVFALDVTSPSSFSASNVMWEFTRADDPDMGKVVGRPQIVRMRTGAPGTTTYRWFAAVASGVNNYVTDSDGLFSSTGNPALFLLALDKPAGTAWTANTNYYKLSIPVDSALSITNATGLVNFRVILGAAREVTQIYMGDLHGKLWKLNFAPYSTADWNFNKLSPYKTTATTPIPLYIALDASTPIPNVQPITMAPSVLAGPTIQGLQTNYVAFATGKFLEFSDRASTATDSVYAVYEDGTVRADSSLAVSVIKGRSRLQIGTANSSTGVVAVPAFKWGRSLSDGDATQRSGWYFEFPNSGEREIFDAQVVGDMLAFNSLIPPAGSTTGSCTAAGGGGYNYFVNIDTGNGTRKVSTVGLLGGLTLFDNGALTTVKQKSNSTGQRVITTTKTIVQTGSTGLTTAGSVSTDRVSGRLSWRQINNYQDLHNAP